MTVCIAAICEKNKSIVVASDRMITAPFLAREFEHDQSKIHVIDKEVVALTAGDATRAIDIFRIIESKLSSESDNSTKEIARMICEEYEKLRIQKIESIYFQPRGMTIEAFYKERAKQLPEQLAIFLDKCMSQQELGLSLIIAGIDESEAHIFTILDPGNMECFDTIGFQAIGIGESHALNSLIGKKISINDNLLTCIYNVYEAKKISEVAPGVGKFTDMSIINEEGIEHLTQKDIDIIDSAHKKLNEPKEANIEDELKNLSIIKKNVESKEK